MAVPKPHAGPKLTEDPIVSAVRLLAGVVTGTQENSLPAWLLEQASANILGRSQGSPSRGAVFLLGTICSFVKARSDTSREDAPSLETADQDFDRLYFVEFTYRLVHPGATNQQCPLGHACDQIEVAAMFMMLETCYRLNCAVQSLQRCGAIMLVIDTAHKLIMPDSGLRSTLNNITESDNNKLRAIIFGQAATLLYPNSAV